MKFYVTWPISLQNIMIETCLGRNLCSLVLLLMVLIQSAEVGATNQAILPILKQSQKLEMSPTAKRTDSEGRRGLRLWIDSDRPELQLKPIRGTFFTKGEAEQANRICPSPCGKLVTSHGNENFVIIGTTAGSTPKFSLAGLQGDWTAKVKNGNRGVYWSGYFMSTLGVVGGTLGGALAVRGLIDSDQNMRNVGLVGVLSSVAATALGQWLLDKGRPEIEWHAGPAGQLASAQ